MDWLSCTIGLWSLGATSSIACPVLETRSTSVFARYGATVVSATDRAGRFGVGERGAKWRAKESLRTEFPLDGKTWLVRDREAIVAVMVQPLSAVLFARHRNFFYGDTNCGEKETKGEGIIGISACREGSIAQYRCLSSERQINFTFTGVR